MSRRSVRDALRDVGHVEAAPGQPPDEERLHGARGELAALGRARRTGSSTRIWRNFGPLK
jgi:hypothetical protein